jgi:hypothetical protein
MNTLELECAIQWCSNKTAIENAQLINAQTYHLLASNKKGQSEARKISKKLTKTTPINPKHRPTIIDTIKKWAGLGVFD